MSLIDTLQNTLSAITTLNRYHLNIPSCSSPLDVEDFSGSEALSQTYHYSIQFTSTDKTIAAEQLLRKPATLSMGTGPLQTLLQQKVVHGVITDFSRISGSADQALYRITIEPYIALLDKQFRTHRFFINKTVPEVVAEILAEHKFKDWEFEFKLKQTYPRRAQINQYQESDLQFIERLLAEVGIFYFFTLQPDTQTEVIHFADRQTTYQFGKKLPLNSPSGMNDSGAVSVWGLSYQQNVVEANVTTKDYNYREAQKGLQSTTADMTRGDGEGVTYGDVYHYQARHLEDGDKYTPDAETGNFHARLDHERFLSRQTQISGNSTDPTLSPGQLLTITDSTLPSTLPELLQAPILMVQIGFTASRKNALRVTFAAVPFSETLCWRPPLKPRPVISGSLTARVTSPKPNDLYAHQDKDGLYWVKFDADLDDKKPGYESMPVRLAKPYGGDTYGFHFPLIQGTEVAIAFHEGDPDRPYISHALHDSRHPDHVTELNNTRNIIRTAGLNKLRMEDKRGEEHVKLSTEYAGKSQLNLGHNVDQKRQLRGEGAELRTDKWVAVRGGGGVFISADKQPSAQGMMLEMSAALSQLQQAQSLTEALRAAAETAKAELADLQTQKALLADTLTELKQAALLLSAPAGIAQTTPKSLQLSAGENVTATSGKNTDFSVLKAFTVAAGEKVSLFAHKLGMKLFASQGKVEIQAQGDEMTLDALKDLRVSSSEGKIVISAKQDILLVGSGGAYIRIGNGEVESGAPDKIIQRAAVWQKFGGQSASQMAQQWQQADFAVTPEFRWLQDDSPVTQMRLSITQPDNTPSAKITDTQGQVQPHNSAFIDTLEITSETKE
ncbi:type VI secretion system Vgr family protein [Serratia sp. DD3]|uniref:type VI secretion system Vgr family protein n=1 Tax=Serratia sp. DD3 TaxID=1410619 RepID=UPI0003C4F2F5|nr:type VI secretion system Vgr family protein [Serratia sp. DD3]KEY58895.1 Rhs element Vgr protein [Serratia sp. DD3]